MHSLLKKIWQHRHELRSIFGSIYFCFHYLPFRQAIKLPILVYKPHFISLGGSIMIAEGIPVRYGMIRLGFPNTSIYPNSGIIYENTGGKIIFNGSCFVGNNSALSISKDAKLLFGNNFLASTSLKLVCYYLISFGENVRIGWDSLVMDNDLHKMAKIGGGFSKGYASIKIGSNCWIANGCKIMKRSDVPDYCVISAGTIVNSKIEAPKYSVVGYSRKIEVLANGVYRNVYDDKIDWNNIEHV